jgi:oxygen-independent coproporphyrinogen-3 oxidase
VDYAFREMQEAGYSVSSAYTVVRDPGRVRFQYRDSLWHGADMVGTGVASFSHVRGTHYQNVDAWEDYVGMLSRGQLPLGRALALTSHQLLVRELILQLKLGEIDARYFRAKFGVEIFKEFDDAFARLQQEGHLSIDGDRVVLAREGLLRVDGLLPEFYEPQFRRVRYT